MVLKTHHIVARDLPDLWFQAVSGLFNKGRKFVVDQGSYDGDGNKKEAQERLQYDFFTGHILNPGYGSGTPEILPQIPAHYNIPNPVAFEYVYGGDGYTRSYLEYVMTAVKQPGESYTYGERLVKAELSDRILALMFGGNQKMINPRKVDGKIIFKYPLKKALENGYFKKIKFDPVSEFDPEKWLSYKDFTIKMLREEGYQI